MGHAKTHLSLFSLDDLYICVASLSIFFLIYAKKTQPSSKIPKYSLEDTQNCTQPCNLCRYFVGLKTVKPRFESHVKNILKKENNLFPLQNFWHLILKIDSIILIISVFTIVNCVLNWPQQPI